MSEAEWIAFLARPEIPAFNRAMLDNPDDDLPRLVFADWMDENCPDVEVNAAVRQSITTEDQQADWPGQRESRGVRFAFVRGRVRLRVESSVRPTQRRRLRTAWEAVWRAGWVESLFLGIARYDLIHSWFRDAPTEGVREVAVVGHELFGSQLTSLLASPRLVRVTSLGLVAWRFPPDFVDALVESDVITRLQSLTIHGNSFGFEEFAVLVVSPRLAGLEEFNVIDSALGDEGAALLASMPHLANLKSLIFRDRAVTAVGAAALADSPYLCEAIRAQWRR